MASITETRDRLNELIAQGHGDLQIVVGFDDVPDYVMMLHVGGVAHIKEDGQIVPVLATWYSNDGAMEFVEPEEEHNALTEADFRRASLAPPYDAA